MAHNLARRLDGSYQALYVGKPAWHGLGTIEAVPQTPEQIQRRVFDQRVIETFPAFAAIGRKVVEVPEFRAIGDKALGKVYGFVSPDYVPIQDVDALRVAGQIVKANRKAMFVSAGALGNGARGFASIDLTRVLGPKALAIANDPSAQEAFLFVDWTHDGSGSVKYGRWRNRVDCNNMLDAANSAAASSGRLARIIHRGDTENIADQIREAERILGFTVADMKLNTKLLNELAAISLPKPDAWFKDFTEVLIPIPAEMERPLARNEARALLTQLWNVSSTLTGVPKTPYRGLQVVAEYGDHFRTLRISDAKSAPERRLRSITEGPSAELKARALELIRQEFEIKVPVAR